MDSGNIDLEHKLICESLLMNIDNLRLLMDIYKSGDINSKVIEFINNTGRNLTASQIKILIDTSLINTSSIMTVFLDIEMAIGTNKELTSSKVKWYNEYIEVLYENLVSNSENLNIEINTWLKNNILI